MKIKKGVQETWSKIAHKFDELRKLPWPDLIDFIYESNFIDTSSNEIGLVLDLGCGNARHIRYIKDEIITNRAFYGIAVDISLNFLIIAKETDDKINYINADANYLPFKDKIFQKILYVAAIHHIPSREMREKSLFEIERVCDAELLISVWRLWQKRFYKYFLDEIKKKQYEQWNGEFGDIWVPWKDQERNIIAKRFYHLYSIDEFKQLVNKSNFKMVNFKIAGTRKEKGTIFALLKIEKN